MEARSREKDVPASNGEANARYEGYSCTNVGGITGR